MVLKDRIKYNVDMLSLASRGVLGRARNGELGDIRNGAKAFSDEALKKVIKDLEDETVRYIGKLTEMGIPQTERIAVFMIRSGGVPIATSQWGVILLHPETFSFIVENADITEARSFTDYKIEDRTYRKYNQPEIDDERTNN